ncbi:MAG: AhpC/TSA family protein [Dysgonamonadaceae bacterium]|jgi:peroxiredoxin|nr:AhpC/TSA family protein [Dysgonamonadaceae bacterium]
MKKIVSFAALVLMLASCRNENEYTIKGVVTDRDLNGEYVVIYQTDETGFETLDVDSALIQNNHFEFKGVIEEPTIYYAFIDAKGVYDNLALGIPILIQPGKITMEIAGNDAVIKGDKENEDYQQFKDQQIILTDNANRIVGKTDDENLTKEELFQLNTEYMQIFNEVKNNVVTYVFNNIDNPFGKIVFTGNPHLFTVSEIDSILALTDESFASNPKVVDILAQAEKMRSKFTSGTKYLDFTSTDINGKKVSLSDYVGKGKFLLIDFWASWCPPCIREIPSLVEFYESMKDRNFEIIGVSLDEDKTAWMKAVKDYNMTWPQVSDLKRESSATKAYQVNEIPYTVFIDPEGNIIADNLRGEELEDFVLTTLNSTE